VGRLGLLGCTRIAAAQTGADLGRVAGEVLADDVRAELVQDRGGGLAFEKEFERRPDQFPGSDNQRPAPAQVARLASLGSGTVCLVAAASADPD